jgi:hypothetical protein
VAVAAHGFNVGEGLKMQPSAEKINTINGKLRQVRGLTHPFSNLGEFHLFSSIRLTDGAGIAARRAYGIRDHR